MNASPRKRQRRPRTTTRGVRLADRLARLCITIGGIGTIVAVTAMLLFLVWVVVPLFSPPEIGHAQAGPARPEEAHEACLALAVDDYLRMGWSSSSSGEFRCFRIEDGSELARVAPLGEQRPSVLAVASTEGRFAAGFTDGSLRPGTLGFSSRFLAPEEVPPGLRALPVGGAARFGQGIVERTPANQFRLEEFTLGVGESLPIGAGHPLRLLDGIELSTGPTFASLSDDGVLRLSRGEKKTNLLTGEDRISLEQGELALALPAPAGLPRWLLLSGLGDNVFLVWEDGTLWRCDTRTLAAPRVVEKTTVLEGGGERVTALGFLIGRTSLAVGDSRGRVRIWFRTQPALAGTPDGVELVHAHELAGNGAAVTALVASARSRMLAAGYEDGSLRLFHATSQALLLEARIPGAPAPVRALALAPKDDGLLAASAEATAFWPIHVPHPEASLAGLFAPVWYESHEKPEHVWQATGGSDDFEPKYGLVPLVFGTLKATCYSLLFGVPIALLAAIYTSEFLHPRRKAKLKPAIEMMASLPSVVLGFLAALVIAPAIEDVVPQVLATIVLIPFVVCLGAHVWSTLPKAWTVRAGRYRLLFVGVCVAVAGVAGRGIGPWVEGLLFSGDSKQWLTGSVGRGTGGWMLLLLPAVAMAVGWAVTVWVTPPFVRRCAGFTPARFACFDLVKFLASTLAVLALTALAATLLDHVGIDSRGGLLGTYVHLNALVVGFAMAFAIIPIVYTLAEDALSAVPDHLRAASLGAGATPWQTAVRVVIPTAMSGIFSAVMIGLGRAVGETMIVLMAAGGTPIMDWNIFNGFRSLSANIATELPEAVQGSTHYRTLFLAALVLFAMTFVLNTLAESVRLRYRRRRVQL